MEQKEIVLTKSGTINSSREGSLEMFTLVGLKEWSLDQQDQQPRGTC